MNNDWVICLFTVLGVVLLVAHMSWRFSRADRMIRGWAAANRLRILRRDQVFLFTGPFFWTTGKGQQVYRVTVSDGEGRTRRGYLRCGNLLFGMLFNEVEVRWDKPRPVQPLPNPRGFPVIVPDDNDHNPPS